MAAKKGKLNLHNYCKADVYVEIKVSNKKGAQKYYDTIHVTKATVSIDQTTKEEKITFSKNEKVIPTYRGGKVEVKFYTGNGKTKFTLDPMTMPKSNQDFDPDVRLSGIELYDPAESKERLFEMGKNLKLEKVEKKDFMRLVDAESLLGRLVIRKGNRNIDNFPLKEVKIKYSKPSTLKDTTNIDRSVVANVKVSVPVFGSVESSMSNRSLYQLNTSVEYFPYQNTVSFTKLIVDLTDEEKSKLVKALKLLPSNGKLYILRSFDVILSAVFSVTNGTKLTVSGSAAIASVFTADGAYSFQSKDSEFISLSEQVYNTNFEEFQSISELLTKLSK